MSEQAAGSDTPIVELTIPEAAATRLDHGEQGTLFKARLDDQPKLLLGDLSITSVPELLTVINSGRRQGDLVLQSDVARKQISFLDGEAVAAHSNVPDDRLGEVMWRQGIISLDQLMIATSQLGQGKRLGRLLIDNGFIGTPELYAGLRAQVHDIFLSVFHFRSGMFCFVGCEPELFTPLSLEEPTEDLIVAGLRQLDELMRLRRAVSQPDTEVVATAPQPRGKLREVEEAVVQLLVSARKPLPLSTVLDKCHLGEYQGLKAIKTLVDGGFATLSGAGAPAPSPTASDDPYEAAAEVINIVCQVLRDECDGADKWVWMYLADLEVSGAALFEEVAESGGPLDAAKLKHAAEQLGGGAEEQLLTALRDGVDFAMFQAAETVEDDRAGELFAQVAPKLSSAKAR